MIGANAQIGDLSPLFIDLFDFFEYLDFQGSDSDRFDLPLNACKIIGDTFLDDIQISMHYEISRNLYYIWENDLFNIRGHENQKIYEEQLLFHAIQLCPLGNMQEWIPQLKETFPMRPLFKLCMKMAKSRCMEAIGAMEELAKADKKRLHIGGYPDGEVTDYVLKTLETASNGDCTTNKEKAYRESSAGREKRVSKPSFKILMLFLNHKA